MVLAGVLLGYLIGGGIVWLMRIFGSLVFGKEALGIGDVHMMAAVGACLGWINPVIAFFAAALLGVAWWLGASLFFGKARRALPYGPYLAAATILVFFARPWIEKALSAYFMGEFRLP
jgi:leader peptidase (prepilin peptidase)/N-methyltransferase